MSCSGGNCTCGKNKESVAEEHIHLVQRPVGSAPLPTFDLKNSLNHLSLEPELVELRFKNGRKAFFRNMGALELAKDDRVIVESGDGYDLGTVVLTGKKAGNKFSDSGMDQSSVERVVRKATLQDLEKWLNAKKTEYTVLLKAREIAAEQGIDISIRDAELMVDGQKVSIYFTASEGLDTRDLQRKYASVLGMRVDMRPTEYS